MYTTVASCQGRTSCCTVNSRYVFQYTAHWIIGAWLCISCRQGKHNIVKKHRDNRLNNWLGYSSFRKYFVDLLSQEAT